MSQKGEPGLDTALLEHLRGCFVDDVLPSLPNVAASGRSLDDFVVTQLRHRILLAQDQPGPGAPDQPIDASTAEQLAKIEHLTGGAKEAVRNAGSIDAAILAMFADKHFKQLLRDSVGSKTELRILNRILTVVRNAAQSAAAGRPEPAPRSTGTSNGASSMGESLRAEAGYDGNESQNFPLGPRRTGYFVVGDSYVKGLVRFPAFASADDVARTSSVCVLVDGEAAATGSLTPGGSNEDGWFATFDARLPTGVYDGQPHRIRVVVPDLSIALATPNGGDSYVLEQSFCGLADGVDDAQFGGWVFDARSPNEPVEVTLYDGDQVVARERTLHIRSDVNQRYGVTGAHGFRFWLPAELFDNRVHHLRAFVGDQPVPAGRGAGPVVLERKHLVESRSQFEGRVEEIDGTRVSGWAVDQTTPHRPVHVTITVDGIAVETVLANTYRARLRQAAKGSGYHAFSYEFPTRLMNGKRREVAVTIAESGCQFVVGEQAVLFPLADYFGNSTEAQLDERDRATAVTAPARRVLTTRPIVSMIILNRDGADLLPPLLASIERTSWAVDLEILLVDHGSSDESLAIAEQYEGRLNLRIIRRNANYTFSESNNYAASLARGQYLAFVNNDIVFVSDCISAMCAHLLDTEIGAVGLRLLEPVLGADGRWTHETHHVGIKLAPIPGLGHYRPVEQREDARVGIAGCVSVPAVTAALLVCGKVDFELVGGFEEGYCYGLEDVDLCHKLALRLGKRIVCDAGLSAVHNRGATRDQRTGRSEGNRFSAQIMLDNRALYQRRFGRALARTTLSSLIAGSDYWRATPLRVTFAVTEANPNTAAGDFFTAAELGTAMRSEFGWEVLFVPKENHTIHGTDVLVVMRHDYDIRKVDSANPGLITVAWIRNRVDQWVHEADLDAYQVLACSSQTAIDYIRKETGREAMLLPIATNVDKFAPKPARGKYATDVVFNGHFWGDQREAVEMLDPTALDGYFAIYGRGWDKCPAWQSYWRGEVPYFDMPAIYSSASIVIDDSHPVTRKWGSLNSRVFDALACGKLVLTNCAIGAKATFGDRLPTFDTKSDLVDKVNHYLAHPEERDALAATLRAEVLDRHSYAHRARCLKEGLQLMQKHLRFAIKVPIPKPEEKEKWGDYHFAKGLQRALRARGHFTRIDLMPDWDTGLAACDDVVLVLRGLSEFKPDPRTLNLLWLISHPNEVPFAEYDRYDHVFVASTSFAELLSRSASTPVSPLLQCADPELFYPDPAADLDVPEVLFVGNSRGKKRQIVADCLASGVDFAVYGGMWERFLSESVLRGTHIPNDELRHYYSGAKVVLNDHWPDMAAQGFISNRIFDAGACGATIVTDRVAGLKSLFGDLVHEYETSAELPDLVSRLKRDREHNRETGIALSRQILQDHTFANRVDTILTAVASHLSLPEASERRFTSPDEAILGGLQFATSNC